MSLKAKLEAVIYASEEPVTLAQLAALFANEALEWKAEQDAARAAEAEQNAQEPAAPAEEVPLLGGEFEGAEAGDATGTEAAVVELEQAAEAGAAQDAAVAEGERSGGDEAEDADAGGDSEANTQMGLETAAKPDPAVVADQAEEAAKADAKRQARQRDREVRGVLRQLLDELIAEYAASERGVEIREIAGGYRMATKPEYHDAVRSFVRSLKPPLKLSLPALETLAVIAYKQPVTAPEVNEIRGVDSSAVFGSLLARKLIATAGRKPVIGRPILYKTTREFLLRFGLKDVSELPSMEEFEKMAAAELEEAEVEAEGESAGEIREDLSLELGEATDSGGDANSAEDNLPDEPGEAVETERAGSEAAPDAPPAAE